MKRRFIVLIDFSYHSQWLLSFVYNWSKQVNAEVLLMHHVIDPTPGIVDREMISHYKQLNSEKALQKLKSFAEDTLGNAGEIQFVVNTFHLTAAISKTNEAGTTDYLFVGLNSKSFFEQLFFGNTALKLSKELDNIIIAFPTNTCDIRMDELYAAIREGYSLNEPALNDIIAIKGDMIRRINFFSVLKPKENGTESEEYLRTLCTAYGNKINSTSIVLRDEEPIAAIKNFMLDNKGVLLIQKGSRSFLDIFRSFFTTEIVNLASIPVIILPSIHVQKEKEENVLNPA